MAEDEFIKLFNHMNKRFDVIERRLEDTASKSQLNTLIKTIDGFLKRLDDIEANNAARDIQYARHDRWLQQIAQKTGVKLSVN